MLPILRHVPEVSVEEFVDGEELTFDTVCADGDILFENVLWYRPRPLQMRMHEWVSPVSIALRDLTVPDLQDGRRMGVQVLAALGFRTGFTHMEWYRKAAGEAVFGEIAARPPGARVVDLMNVATRRRPLRRLGRGGAARAPDASARAALQRRQHLQAGARHRTRSPGSTGLDALRAEYGEDVVLVDLLPVGAPRRDWRATVVSDGWIVVRHHELQRVIEMTERFAADLHLYAG